MDDRGVGGSSGKVASSTSEDFAGDVEAGIATLKARPDINPKAIGLIGHSEGGIIAPLVATRSSDVAFIVLLAGTGLPGDEILISQVGLILKASGADQKKLDEGVRCSGACSPRSRPRRTSRRGRKRYRPSSRRCADDLPEPERKEFDESRKAIDAQIAQLYTPWFQFFLTYRPTSRPGAGALPGPGAERRE